MTHRKKWMAVTLAALAVSSLAIGLAGLFLLHASLLKTAAEQRDLVQENLSSRLEKQLAYFSGTADFLCGKETTRYLTSLARLRPEEDTRALKAAFEDYLHGTALDTHSIQSVCFVGENENQAGYLYETASRREIPVEIPATDSWLRSGLADLLLGDGTLVYIQDDAVEEVLARPYFERYPAQKEAVEEWLGYLSGRYCYVLPRERYGVILVLDSQVFDRLHQAFPWETDGAALCAGDGRILWQTGEWIARARAGEEPVLLDGSLPLADTKLRLYYVRRAEPRAYLLFAAVYLGASLLLLAVAVAAVNRMARRILAPFDRLTDRIRASMSSDDFEPIPADDPALFTGRPLYRRIFRLFAVGLLLPAVCLGLLSSLLTNRMLASRLTGVAALHAAALQGALDDSLAISESILKMISGKPDFAEAAALSIDSLESGDYRERALELNSYINRYPLGMFNVAYLALQDVEGHAKYQSLYLDEESAESQLSRFSLLDQPDALAQVRALEGDTGLLLCANLYKQPAVAAVQKLYDPQGKVAGYLQMVYNQSYFQEISTRQTVGFLVFRQSDHQLVYNSGADGFAKVLEENALRPGESLSLHVGGRGYLLNTRAVDTTDWMLAVFQRTDDLMSVATAALLQDALLLAVLLGLLLLLSLRLARWMSQPLRAIEQDLGRVIENGCRGFVPYTKKDELSRLVDTYNQVIGQLNSLMDSMVEKKTIEQRLTTLQTQAELESLRQQIASHFFRNTLENIHMQIQNGDKDSACRMLIALSRLFSYGMTNQDRIELEKEIDYVENYITIQRYRLHDAFTVRWNIDENARLTVVPKLILQPLVENCITHGLYEYQSGGLITISAVRRDDRLELQVADNGVGMSAGELEELRQSLRQPDDADKRSGLALKNIYTRLRLYAGEGADMTIDSRPMRGTTVRIRLPLTPPPA